MAFCRKCGTEIKEGAFFCHSCGFKITDDLIQPVDASNKTSWAIKNHFSFISKFFSPAKLKKFLNWKSTVVLSVAIMLIVSFAVVFFHKSDEEKIFSLVNNLGEAMTEGDFEKLLECFEPKSQSQMEAFMNIGSAIGGNYLGGADLRDIWSLGSIGMAGESDDSKLVFTVHRLDFIDKDTAELELSASCDSPSASHGVLKVIKIDGKWYFEAGSLF